MTQNEFNKKYKANIPEGYWGLEFDIEPVTDYLDHEISMIIKDHGDLQIHQIKLKFGKARFYTNLYDLVGPVIARMAEWYIEGEINERVDEYYAGKKRKELLVEIIDTEGEPNILQDMVLSDTPASSWVDEYKDDYDKLLASGMFWEFHPEWTGEWDKDKFAFCHDKKFKNKI